MTPAPSVEPWPSAFRIGGALLVAAMVGLWAAGYAFLMLMKLPPESATLSTIVDYWLAYGDRPEVR